MSQIRNIVVTTTRHDPFRKNTLQNDEYNPDKQHIELPESSCNRNSLSSTTIDSPLVSPGKSNAVDAISISEFQEDECCWNFLLNGFCEWGSQCGLEHRYVTNNSSSQINSALLNNFPEMILHRPTKRIHSFLF